MRERLKGAFGQVRAGEDLKERTKSYLTGRARGGIRSRTAALRLLPAAACLALVLAGGHWLYFTPTVEISIDVNPSIALAVNRFDRVIAVDGRNADGEALAAALSVENLSCTQAMEEILANDTVSSLLSSQEVMTIGVIGPAGEQAGRILSALNACTAGAGETYCYYAHTQEAEAAHDVGLSCGKYRAYQALQDLGSTLTPEEVRDMTMRELRSLLQELSDGTAAEPWSGGGHDGTHAGHGYGQGNGCGQGNGRGQGYGSGRS